MKAIAVRQPQITRLASGELTIEVKTWRTDYRGEILLVSAMTPRIEPAGYALAVGNLVDCRPMTRADEKGAGKRFYQQAQVWVFQGLQPIRMFPVKLGLAVFEVPVPPFGIKRTTQVLILVPEVRSRPRALVRPSRRAGLNLGSPPGECRILDVLVVDADAAVARGIQKWVLHQHRARLVASIAEALAAIRERTPDVVLCDYEVGLETTASLLEALAATYPQVRRVLYSSARPDVWQRLIDVALVHGAVVRPATRQQLIDIIAA